MVTRALFLSSLSIRSPSSSGVAVSFSRSEEHTSELQSRGQLVCRLLLEKKTPFYWVRRSPAQGEARRRLPRDCKRSGSAMTTRWQQHEVSGTWAGDSADTAETPTRIMLQ